MMIKFKWDLFEFVEILKNDILWIFVLWNYWIVLCYVIFWVRKFLVFNKIDWYLLFEKIGNMWLVNMIIVELGLFVIILWIYFYIVLGK